MGVPSPLVRIVMTPGEPAGIGPDIVLTISQQSWPVELIAIADPDLLKARAKQLKLDVDIIECADRQPVGKHQPGQLFVLPVKLNTKSEAGILNVENADYVIRTLNKAAELCLSKKADALVTGPVHKGVINEAGIPFSGHTEFFAQYCHVPCTVMLFVVGNLKIALTTTHLPLSHVSSAITPARLRSVLSVLQTELQHRFHIVSPRLLICGLNPHAGEGGHLGREEIEVMIPVIEALRQEGYQIEGPLPADTLFTPPFLQRADAVLAMYHDQALPVVKCLGFGQAVNITLGLPFIRTSVDHGTALHLAGTNTANAASLEAAVNLAISLTQPSSDGSQK